MDIQGDYEEIFGQTFSKQVINTVQYTFREEYRKTKSPLGGPRAHSI